MVVMVPPVRPVPAVTGDAAATTGGIGGAGPGATVVLEDLAAGAAVAGHHRRGDAAGGDGQRDVAGGAAAGETGAGGDGGDVAEGAARGAEVADDVGDEVDLGGRLGGEAVAVGGVDGDQRAGGDGGDADLVVDGGHRGLGGVGGPHLDEAEVGGVDGVAFIASAATPLGMAQLEAVPPWVEKLAEEPLKVRVTLAARGPPPLGGAGVEDAAGIERGVGEVGVGVAERLDLDAACRLGMNILCGVGEDSLDGLELAGEGGGEEAVGAQRPQRVGEVLVGALPRTWQGIEGGPPLLREAGDHRSALLLDDQ